ncbi:MAG: hypothetical protein ILM98_14245 [Kiritimatiellae bacterium]|nr:hypothetical protein [Kiritimatiellia bacterium]
MKTTFARRNTTLPPDIPAALTSRFSGNPTKKAQRVAFLRNGGLPGDGLALQTVIERIRLFLLPVVNSHNHCGAAWVAGVGWSAARKRNDEEGD